MRLPRSRTPEHINGQYTQMGIAHFVFQRGAIAEIGNLCLSVGEIAALFPVVPLTGVLSEMLTVPQKWRNNKACRFTVRFLLHRQRQIAAGYRQHQQKHLKIGQTVQNICPSIASTRRNICSIFDQSTIQYNRNVLETLTSKNNIKGFLHRTPTGRACIK